MQKETTKSSLAERIKSFYQLHEKRIDIGVFVGGFIFDIFTLGRVDDPLNILQQLFYLLTLALLLYFEIWADVLKRPLPPKWQKALTYRNLMIHFLLGSLLSVYTLFYFKSASFGLSFIFVALVVALMFLNELPFFQKLGFSIRTVLWSLCLVSFFAIHSPTLFGFFGWIPFLFALLAASTLTAFFFKRLRPLFEDFALLKKIFLFPSLGTYLVILLLYTLKLLPPVPLSLEYMGIYHKIAKQGDKYELTYERSAWKFWQNGAQTFPAEEGDRINSYFELFAPKNFKDNVKVRWLLKDPKRGWMPQDSIEISIVGGREGGFRGYATKSNYQPGDWQVRVETLDGREIGHINFHLEKAETAELRQFRVDLR